MKNFINGIAYIIMFSILIAFGLAVLASWNKDELSDFKSMSACSNGSSLFRSKNIANAYWVKTGSGCLGGFHLGSSSIKLAQGSSVCLDRWKTTTEAPPNMLFVYVETYGVTHSAFVVASDFDQIQGQ